VHGFRQAAAMPGRRPRTRLTGPATRFTARAAGITDRQLQHPDVERLSRDTYLPRALAGDVHQRLAAILLTAPAGAVLSHLTAARLWGIEVPLQPAGERRVDLIVPGGSHAESRSDRRIHRQPLATDEITRFKGYAVTGLERTWRDLRRAPALGAPRGDRPDPRPRGLRGSSDAGVGAATEGSRGGLVPARFSRWPTH
jgi:hypothetical protein